MRSIILQIFPIADMDNETIIQSLHEVYPSFHIILYIKLSLV